MSPKVSIVIPAYNVEAELPRCLESAAGQSLREIEIVCVDDGSPDRSLEIMREYAARDARFRVISQPNKGLGGARNTGAAAATGEYILFVDSDDWIDPDYCLRLYEAAVRHDAPVACASIRKIRPSSAKWTAHFDEERVYDDPQARFAVCNCPPDFHVVNKLLRREMVERLGLRFREHVPYEDVEYTMRVLCEGGRLVTVPGPYYRYMVRGGSITKSVQTPQKQAARYRAHKAFVAYCDAHGIALARKHRTLTKRYYAWFGITLLKIKDRDGLLIARLFDCLPVWFRRQ